MKNTKKVFSYLWKFLKKYKISFFGSAISFFTVTLIQNTTVPLYVKKLVDEINTGGIDEAFRVGVLILVLLVLSRFIAWIGERFLIYAQTHLAEDLHTFSFTKFTRHSPNFYANRLTGSLIEKLPRLGENSLQITNNVTYNFFFTAVAVVGILFVLFRENYKLGILFSVFLVVYVLLAFLIAKKVSPLFEERSRAKSSFRALIADIIGNIQIVKVFSALSYEKKKFREVNRLLGEKREHAWVVSTNYQYLIKVIPSLFIGVVTLYSIHLLKLGMVSAGTVVMVFLLGRRFGMHVEWLSNSIKWLSSTISDCVESIEIIETEVDLKNPRNPEECRIQKGDIRFENISFTYKNGEHVFENFSLSIPAGQRVGVVGKSGSGKSTLVKLLLRFYDPDSGVVTIDGQGISKIRIDDLRKHIAYIPQETVLFHRSIYENIAYGKLNAKKEDILRVAKDAYVDEFVSGFEDGYETKVGERGIKLSGGQRQRVGIARAMLREDAPILILDEATSSLDSMSEHYIQESFEKLSQNRTTIVIAHRLSTIQKMDRIIVMEEGKVIEDGTHQELLSNNAFYAQLWNSQVNGFIQDEE